MFIPINAFRNLSAYHYQFKALWEGSAIRDQVRLVFIHIHHMASLLYTPTTLER